MRMPCSFKSIIDTVKKNIFGDNSNLKSAKKDPSGKNFFDYSGMTI